MRASSAARRWQFFQEILEAAFMTLQCAPRARLGEDTPALSITGNALGVLTMRWEIPQAVDFRFGMEITMYIANR